MKPLPVIDLAGSPHQRGLQHGRALRDQIRENVRVYFERYDLSAAMPRAEVLQRADRFRRAIAEQSPDYAEQMRGVAVGSGCSEGEIAALNVRFELLYQRWGEQLQVVDGCTAFAVLPHRSATGAMLTGQNWDWIPRVQCAVLRTRRADGPDSVAFTEAGIVGAKIGFNSAGVTLTVNGLMSLADDWTRLRRPFHVRCDDVLAAGSMHDALAALVSEPRNCSANFLITGAPDSAVSVETAPAVHMELRPEGNSGSVVHSNHFVDCNCIGVQEPPNDRRPHSRYRRERLSDQIAGSRAPVTVEQLKRWLAEHEGEPEGMCRHDEASPDYDQIVTVTSAIIEPTERRMHITPSQPCLGGWQTIEL